MNTRVSANAAKYNSEKKGQWYENWVKQYERGNDLVVSDHLLNKEMFFAFETKLSY